MRRRLALLAVPAALLAGAAAAVAAPSQRSWAQPQIDKVVAAGLMESSAGAFRPQAPLTQGALAQIVAGLDARLTPPAPAPPPPPATVTTTTTTTTVPTSTDPTETTTAPTATTVTATTTVAAPPVAPPPPEPPWPLLRYRAVSSAATVSLAEFDRVLVTALGLSDAAAGIRSALTAAGLQPPLRAGTETIARLIGLRLNHPADQDNLELLPDQPITRAEAAYSVSQSLGFDKGAHDWVEQLAAGFQLPPLTPWQKRILTTAVSYVGYPYVWGGTDPYPEAPFGVRAPGGFDCSGLVWRVYKLTRYPGEGRLASVIGGRSTFEMAAESTRQMKIFKVGNLEPGDVLLFGNGPQSPSSQIDHAALYLGNGWLVQSSGEGVTIAPFDGWYRSSFAFARRPLREAGLDR